MADRGIARHGSIALPTDNKRREIGAHAARHLIGADVSRLSSLGEPLIRAIHGDEEIYAGRPHPTSASLRALTDAWVLDPSATVELVERLGASISDESRDETDITRRLLGHATMFSKQPPSRRSTFSSGASTRPGVATSQPKQHTNWQASWKDIRERFDPCGAAVRDDDPRLRSRRFERNAVVALTGARA